jgi:hypothetical protein
MFVTLIPAIFANGGFEDPGRGFMVTNPRQIAMGGAGVATADAEQAFFQNPAALGAGKFSLNLPSATISLYHIQNLHDRGLLIRAPELLMDYFSDFSVEEGVANDYVASIPAGDGHLGTIDIATSFTAGAFGMGLFIQEDLLFKDSNNGEDNFKFVVEQNIALPIGLGFRLPIIRDQFSLDIGAVVRPTYLAYTEKISNLTESFLEIIQLAAGWAIPIDVGLDLNFPAGIRVSTVVRNLNATYTMHEYSEMGLWVNEMMELVGQEGPYSGDGTKTGPSYRTLPWSWDVGLGWEPRGNGLFKPVVAVDLADINTMIENANSGSVDIMEHLRAGIELKLLSVINLRAGYAQQRASVGAGVDLAIARVDLAYVFPESEGAGNDVMSVRVSIGW